MYDFSHMWNRKRGRKEQTSKTKPNTDGRMVLPQGQRGGEGDTE